MRYRRIFVLIIFLIMPLELHAAQLQSGLFTIQHAESDAAIARESTNVLQDALEEFPPELAAGNEPVQVVIASTFTEFRHLAGAYGKAQVSGVAQGERGLIVVKAPYLMPPEADYPAVLRHELAHVLMARNTNPNYVPRWFDEGVAMLASRELRWTTSFSLARMYLGNGVIPYREINFAFAPMGDEVAFGDAYAQAYSMTQYLQEKIGEETFWQLVHELKYQDFDKALKNVTGLTPGAFYDGWKSTLWKFALVAALVSGFGLFQLMALLVLIAYWIKHRRGQNIVREWAEEDATDHEPDDIEYDSPWTPIEEDDEEARW